jgi:hypothetical protein
MSRHLFRTGDLSLSRFDWAQGRGICDRREIHVISPQGPSESGCASDSLKLKPVWGDFGKADVGGGGCYSGPAENVIGM